MQLLLLLIASGDNTDAKKSEFIALMKYSFRTRDRLHSTVILTLVIRR